MRHVNKERRFGPRFTSSQVEQNHSDQARSGTKVHVVNTPETDEIAYLVGEELPQSKRKFFESASGQITPLDSLRTRPQETTCNSSLVQFIRGRLPWAILALVGDLDKT